MENGVAGRVEPDSHVPVTDDVKQRWPDCHIPRVNFDDLNSNCSFGVRHIAAQTVCGGKPLGKRDAYSLLSLYISLLFTSALSHLNSEQEIISVV